MKSYSSRKICRRTANVHQIRKNRKTEKKKKLVNRENEDQMGSSATKLRFTEWIRFIQLLQKD